MNNQVQLLTYCDRLGGGGFETLSELLQTELSGLFGGVHILPFYHPIDGSDAGFDPIDHGVVDPRLGSWSQLKALSGTMEIMADLIVNHASADSAEFADVLKQGRASPYWPMFLKREDIFPNGPTPEQEALIYRIGPGSCFLPITLASGETVEFWRTFTDNQIDINVQTPEGQAYLDKVLNLLAQYGVSTIRLDAAGFAVKKADTDCFMTDDTFEFINRLSAQAKALGMETIAECHSHYRHQVEIAKRIDKVYDFALPPLILYALCFKDPRPLAKWLDISPRNCLTVLDTHDGIGVIDAGPQDDKPGILDSRQLDALVEAIHNNSRGQSRRSSGSAAGNIDLYQVNCSYYDALGGDDYAYLLARALQFFAPGIPQVYYAGLLAQHNDMALLEKTNVGRDISRPYLSRADITEAMEKPVVKGLCRLIRLRNDNVAFNGKFSLQNDNHQLTMTWENGKHHAALEVDFKANKASITAGGEHFDIKQLASGLIDGQAL